MRPLASLLTVVALLLLNARPAPAQDEPGVDKTASEPGMDPQRAREKAKLHNATAKRLFNLGLFEQAAEEYMKAYRAKPAPAFLFNLAQCHKRITKRNHIEKAIFYFKSYLQNVPGTPMRKEVEAEINKLELQLKVAKATKPDTKPLEPTPTVAKKRPFYKKWWFWTLIGVAVTGATVGTVVALQPEDETAYPTDFTQPLP